MITGSFSCLLALCFPFNPIHTNPICQSHFDLNFLLICGFLLNVPLKRLAARYTVSAAAGGSSGAAAWSSERAVAGRTGSRLAPTAADRNTDKQLHMGHIYMNRKSYVWLDQCASAAEYA